MADPLTITLHASAAELAGGSATAVDLWGTDAVETRRFAELRLLVAAIAGSGATLVVTVETSPDNATWRSVDAFTARTATGVVELATGDLDRYARCSWTLTAGGSATFSVAGYALETFCTLAQLSDLGAARAAISGLSKADRIRRLVAATETAHGYLVRRHQAPFIRVGRDVAQAVAKMASLALLTDVVGVNPHAEATALVLDEARAKERWLRDVSNGIAGANVVDSTPTVPEGTGAVVVTGTSRQWGSMRIC